ncbi:HAMP domain-containing protein [Pantoea sp. Acro-805]|uniref:HAMP domain-containing protein n=1 Tax=Candidatus Pantoea formicae TaxID=2608355 RepID=A0ABX0R234_9GAMM|nr:methyl-accepting chemotaxis protein [Pantoea formicae]MDF7647136.1 methyl-accepting chemotaxis protein [Erwiniaceae bacterium L1_54_3]NIF01177.1 HAMP domain-containing protein [Pantoea formicae]
MLNKLKIYTAISMIIVLFAVVLFSTISFSVFNSWANNENFKKTQISSYSNNQMRDAAYNISAALANTNGIMLLLAQGETASTDLLQTTARILQSAGEDMEQFMSSPFNSQEETKAAEEVNTAFKAVYDVVQMKMDHLQRNESYRGSLEGELKLRTTLNQRIEAYNQINFSQNQDYISTAAANYRYMIAIGIIVTILAVVLLITVRIWLRHTLVRRMESTVEVLKRVSAGDLSRRVEIGSANEIGTMLGELEQMRVSLTDTILSIRESVLHIHTNAQEIAQGNSDLSARTEEQAASLQQTAASMEEIKTTVRQNADNAHTARQLAESASDNAQQGGNVMLSLEQIMAQIIVSSRQIADINGVIDSIANQTNILALNAAVEAARAGEQGRGFAVVAEEVRNLAKRSADAAKEINQLIQTCVSNMDTGSRQVNQASVVMQDIVSSVAQVRQIMGEITSASDEQSTGINQISQAVNEMDLVTQQNAAMVEEAAMAAGGLEAQSDALEKLVAQFVLSSEGTVQHTRPDVKTASKRQEPLSKKENVQWESF